MKPECLQSTPFSELDRAMVFAQAFTSKLTYSVKKDAKMHAGSLSTAYSRLQILERFGLAKVNRDVFTTKSDVVTQPFSIRKRLFESFIALQSARRFGKYYNESDVSFAKKHLPEESLVTLDYAAWELTRYQTPSKFFMYVPDVEGFANLLIGNNFHEGRNGSVVLLPKLGNFDNATNRIYLDCIANGGRSTLDGIALELLYGDAIQDRGHFPVKVIKKVQEDLPGLEIV